MSSIIDVGGGPAHNRIEVSLISEVNDNWQRFLTELQSPGEHGTNNNELKQRIAAFAEAGARLTAQVLNLPAQGRELGMKATDIVRATQQMGKIQ